MLFAAIRAAEMKQLSLRLILDSLNSTVEKHLNAFANKTLLHHLSRIRIFFVEQMSFVMQQENLGTQPAKGLGQFAANRATADHRQPARLVGQVENSFVCEKARLDQARLGPVAITAFLKRSRCPSTSIVSESANRACPKKTSTPRL